MSLLGTLPATERAMRDTNIARAPLPTIDALAAMYSLPRPTNLDEEAWRQALRAVLYAPRGTRGNMQAFLEAAWAPQYGRSYTCTVAPGAPQTLTWVAGGAGGFTKADVGRLFRVTWSKGSSLFWSVAPTFIGGAQTLNTLTLCAVGTAYWQAANFAVLSGQEAITAVRLPFVWVDYNAEFFLAADVAGAVPPTYLQPQVRWGASLAGGTAGDFDSWAASDNTDSPTWLVPSTNNFNHQYVVTAETAGTWRNLLVNADHDPNNPAGVPARGGTYTIELYKWTAGAWVSTTLTCSMAANSKLAADSTHSVVLAAGDQVALFVTANAGVNKPLLFPNASVYIDRPAGEPEGGYILPDAATNADGANGQIPLYLDASLDAAFMGNVDRLLASGVVVTGDVADFTQKDSYW